MNLVVELEKDVVVLEHEAVVENALQTEPCSGKHAAQERKVEEGARSALTDDD